MKNKNQQRKIRVKRRVFDVLELPLDAFNEMFKYSMIGDCQALIEGYDSLYAYSDREITLLVCDRLFRVTGENLEIQSISAYKIMIIGTIISAGFISNSGVGA